jgi:hypothetical protein
MNDLYRISFVFVFDSSSKDLEDSSSKDLEWAKKELASGYAAPGRNVRQGVIKFDLPDGTPDQEPLRPSEGHPTSYEEFCVIKEVQEVFGNPKLTISHDDVQPSRDNVILDIPKRVVGDDGVVRFIHKHKLQFEGSNLRLQHNDRPVAATVDVVFMIPSSLESPGHAVCASR